MPRESANVRKTLESLQDATTAPLRIHFPSTVVRQPGISLTKAESAPTPTFSVAASALNNIVSLPNCDLSPTTSAASTTSSSIPASAPVLSAAAAATDPTLSESSSPISVPRFIVAALDLDPPYPSLPILGPLLHGLQADLTLATDQIDPDDDFIHLHQTTDSSEGIEDADVVGYMGPAPPGFSSPHRYMFLLWEQPEGMTRDKIRDALGVDAEADNVGVLARVRWDMESFEKKLGLGKAVAGNYFVC
ncbi:phosphatidylethanolamine-binding protein [Podospora didyma]|uniref:Phosphatidylethanolamine-binding protein n=1 Tax=Podospora didyma TaxID=330526 RepID=A0AAE0NYI5_9PEZI|nr:phosphatidylethanolamine-binding protein [Podospora didyma]